MCCPGCCRSVDLGTHEWCVDCEDNPCCRSVHRSERDPIYDRPSPNEQRGIPPSVAEQVLHACMDKYNIAEKPKPAPAVAAATANNKKKKQKDVSNDTVASDISGTASKTSTSTTTVAKVTNAAEQKQGGSEADAGQEKNCTTM